MTQKKPSEPGVYSFSPWRGCLQIDAGCDKCWAKRMSRRNPKLMGGWESYGPRVLASRKAWKAMRKLDRQASREGVRYRVNFHWGDPFEDWASYIKDHEGRVVEWCDQCGKVMRRPQRCKCHAAYRRPAVMHDVRREFFQLIDETPNLTWMLLTKRPENIARLWPGEHRANVMLGVSATDTKDATRKCAELARVDHFVYGLWLACEPLLGPLDLVESRAIPFYECQCGHKFTVRIGSPDSDGCPRCNAPWPELNFCGVDWIFVGGETGYRSRPCHTAWVESIIQQADSACVPIYVSHLGRTPVGATNDPLELSEKNGRDVNEWPENLRVRELPDFDLIATDEEY